MSIKRKLGLAALTAVASYAATVGTAYLTQRRILYRQPKTVYGTVQQEIILEQHGDEPCMRGWVLHPGQENALIYYGGSSESVENRIPKLMQYFPDHTIYLMPYRGFGPNHDYCSEEHKIKADSIRLYHHVKNKHNYLHVVGRSLGTGVAIHVAARNKVDTLSLVTPYDSILEVAKNRAYSKIIPQLPRLFKDKFESWRDAIKLTLPVNVLLAEIDVVTPHERWHSLKKHIHTEIFENILPGTNHTNIMDKDSTWLNIQNFVHQSQKESSSIDELLPLKENEWVEVRAD